jgi:hypothetical protein
MLSANADRRIHLLADDAAHSLCGYATTQIRPATVSEASRYDWCIACHERAGV